MTPMVDVVFQLMTFMLFSVQMTGGEKVEVPPARHGVGVEESAATFLTLLKPGAPGAEPQVLLGNGDGSARDARPGPQGGRRRGQGRAGARSSSRPTARSRTARSSSWPPPSPRSRASRSTSASRSRNSERSEPRGGEPTLAHWDVFHADRLEVERSLSTEAVRAALARGDLRDDDLIRPAGTTIPWARLADLPALVEPAPGPPSPRPSRGRRRRPSASSAEDLGRATKTSDDRRCDPVDRGR